MSEIGNTSSAGEFAGIVHTNLQRLPADLDLKTSVLQSFYGGLFIYVFLHFKFDSNLSQIIQTIKPTRASLLANETTLVALMTCVFLGFAIIFGLISLSSRAFGNAKGRVFFGAIANYRSGLEYATNVISKTATDLLSDILEHCYELAIVVRRKTYWSRLSFRFGMVGLIFFLGAMIIH